MVIKCTLSLLRSCAVPICQDIFSLDYQELQYLQGICSNTYTVLSADLAASFISLNLEHVYNI